MALIDSIMEWVNCQAKEEADWYGRDKFEKIINIICKFLKDKVKKGSTNTRRIDFVKLEHCYTKFCSDVKDVHELKNHFTIETQEENIYYDPMSIGRISVQTEDADWFMDFLKKYRYICEPDYFLDFSWNLSNGENSLLSLFASFYYIFDADYASGRHGEYKIRNLCDQKMYDCNSVILLIDEADLTYHPEWQREYIALLTKFITMVYPKSCCKDIQIMLTTHSPLLLSDIPQSNVIYLNLDREGKKIVLDTSGKVGTFGQNILLILRDGFFLKGTMGHFAQNKIADINKEVQKIKEEISVVGDRNMSEGEKSETASALQSKKALAELIAEPIIRRKLIQDIDGCITFLSGQPAGDDLSNLSDDELDTRINRMKEELARRKS